MSNDGIEAASLGFSPRLRGSTGLGSDVSRPSVGGGVEPGAGRGAPGGRRRSLLTTALSGELNYNTSSNVITLAHFIYLSKVILNHQICR